MAKTVVHRSTTRRRIREAGVFLYLPDGKEEEEKK